MGTLVIRHWLSLRSLLSSIVAIAVLLPLLLAACSGPGSGDDDPTPTETSAQAVEPTATATTEAATSESAPATETSADAAPTETPAAEPTATESVPADTETPTEEPPTATATEIPLPQGGAELLIQGEQVDSMIAGDLTGQVLYAVTGETLNVSGDGGITWLTAGEHPGGELIVSASDQQILYAGDRSSCGRGVSFFEFNRSGDGGESWENIPASMDIQPMFAFEGDSNAYVYGTDCGLQISDNSGDSWTLFADLAGEEIFSVTGDLVSLDNLLYVVGVTEGGTGRLFVIDITNRTAPNLNGAIAQFFGDAGVGALGSRIVVATAARTGVSDDGGETWTWTRDGLGNATYTVDPLEQEIPADEQEEFFRFNIVQFNPANPDEIWIAGNHGAFRSIDGGLTWVLLGDASPVDSLVVSTVTGRVFVSSAGGTRAWTLSGE